MGRRTERIEFAGSGDASLSGVIEGPGEGDGPGLVLAHCFTCSKDLPTMVKLARGLVAAGYTLLRFDFTGLGDSDGDFADTTLSTDVDDVAGAVSALSDRGVEPVAAVGHSFGGLAVLLAAHRMPKVRAVAVVNTPCGTGHLRGVLADAEDRIRAEGRADVQLAGRSITISAALLDDLDDHDVQRRIADLGRPLLVVHAVDDAEIDVAEGERLFAAARQPKSFVALSGADHLLTPRGAAAGAARAIADFLDREGHGGVGGDREGDGG